ncbi:hypothetical protein FNU79_08790 [Deinococcus detaillensis]|uniref:Nicotinamide mononucleotide transporter n=1 Tax=Deinococcus detaillensis TaxID=2592048 RepID=A0A553V093_9DEIO|nr:nicotinamide mononucleotide transporter [Deinococcus detaillensis]TSA85870.1 hypothetical protein FNU79_08790 [Deinococcus detaillensis]
MNAAVWPYWSWVLPILGVTALWASGSGKRWGWLVGFVGQLLWVAYALASRQYGFLLSALAFAAIYARNYLHWRGDIPARRLSGQPCLPAQSADLPDTAATSLKPPTNKATRNS